MLYSDLRRRASTRPLCVRELVVGLQCNSLFCITANYELEGLSRHALAFRTYMLRNIGLAALPDRAATGAIGAFASLRAHARCLAAVRRARVALPMSSAAERRLLSAALSLRRRAPQVRAHHEPEVVARSARRGEPRGGPRASVPAPLCLRPRCLGCVWWIPRRWGGQRGRQAAHWVVQRRVLRTVRSARARRTSHGHCAAATLRLTLCGKRSVLPQPGRGAALGRGA
jgi:hypothetical protein